MALSWSQIPHVTCQAEVDITQLEAFRRRHKANVESQNGRLTLTTFALKAAVAALKAFPKFNSALDIDAGELILKQYYHIGVAVDTEDGLIVPVIRDADRKSLTELAIEMYEMVQLTRQRKTSIEQMQGGTFTITNIGHMGGDHFTPIINYPEVAIMGMGAARMKPVVVEKRENVHDVLPRLILPIVITFDHRVLDGAEANRFLKVIIDALEDPDVLMMTMS
jgi:pyruvate dehydrogenase E2 component (dihydrolipoamide acetyltransferase)